MSMGLGRRLVLAASSATAVGVTADTLFGEKLTLRCARTVRAGLMTIVDYKLRWDPEKIGEIHTRVAKRICDTCAANGGLYIKMGQGVASMNHILPPQWQEIFSVLQDKAPVVTRREVETMFMEEFGKLPEEMYREFDYDAIASASIAQVHKATTLEGEAVAVKVQKPYIRGQMPVDLFMYRVICGVLQWTFDMPLLWSVNYIDENIRKEADFINECKNAERCAADVQSHKVYVPKIHWDMCTSRITTTEWIDGIRLSDSERLKEAGLPPDRVMKTLTKVFAKQIFHHGFVHCDPHPGNVLVRPQPNPKFWSSNNYQVVLLDHGLYIEEGDPFRVQYCNLWRAIFMLDIDKVTEICKGWGIDDSEFFASFTLMKPFSTDNPSHLTGKTTKADLARMQVEAKERVRNMLVNTALIPLELVFVFRNLNLVRANNKALGSPVNRVNILAMEAAKGSDSGRTILSMDYLQFRTTLLAFSIAHFSAQSWAAVSTWFGYESKGFEDIMDERLKNTLEFQLGFVVEVDE
eukprot:GFYU01011515.1.p1 GENE.GFYU01011515.1~~GFYU01011515.1.p1  ORF type:complete len:522 (+),score=81.26 GFYU01011515.1:132-1697(+)